MNAIQKATKEIGRNLTKNSPAILTGVAVAGVCGTVVLAVQATPRALSILEDACAVRKVEELSTKEVVELTWKLYLPATIMGAITIGCIVGLNTVHTRRTAALASLYSISESALKEYQAKVVEIVGENKARAVKDAVAKDKVEKNPPVNADILHTGRGTTLCLDSMSGRYFYSDIEAIRKVQNNINERLLQGGDDYAALNDVYYELGLAGTKMGEEVGWCISDGILEFDFSSQLTATGVPCLVLDYKVNPKYEFDC